MSEQQFKVGDEVIVEAICEDDKRISAYRRSVGEKGKIGYITPWIDSRTRNKQVNYVIRFYHGNWTLTDPILKRAKPDTRQFKAGDSVIIEEIHPRDAYSDEPSLIGLVGTITKTDYSEWEPGYVGHEVTLPDGRELSFLAVKLRHADPQPKSDEPVAGGWYERISHDGDSGFVIGNKYQLIKSIGPFFGTFKTKDGYTMKGLGTLAYFKPCTPPIHKSTVAPCDNFNNPMAALKGVLPDVWGHGEHKRSTARLAALEAGTKAGAATAVSLLVKDIKQKLCGAKQDYMPVQEQTDSTEG